LLAKLQPEQQEEALVACYQESYANAESPSASCSPSAIWIEHNILLELATAPFSKEDAQLVPEAGTCINCPKQTRHVTPLPRRNMLYFHVARTSNCSSPLASFSLLRPKIIRRYLLDDQLQLFDLLRARPQLFVLLD
jgi:hypothetical protein